MDMNAIRKTMKGLAGLMYDFREFTVLLVVTIIVLGAMIGNVLAATIPNMNTTLNTTLSGLATTVNTWVGYITDNAGLALSLIVIGVLAVIFSISKGKERRSGRAM